MFQIVKKYILRHPDAALAAAASCLSLIITGYAFGHINNIFHLPILLSLYDLPQYENDVFIQSLRHFSSGVWMILGGLGEYVYAPVLFFILLAASRFLTFWGLLYCAEYWGLKSHRERLILTCCLVAAQALYVSSFAGSGGIFLNYFTHSEMANGLTLLALGLILRKNLVAGLAVNGIVFFVNAFIAVWNFIPIGLLLLYKLINSQMTFAEVFRKGLSGSVLFLVFALPVLLNIFENPTFGLETGFSYQAFLAEYYPGHFLFNEIGAAQKLQLLMIITLAVMTLKMIGPPGKEFLIVTAGYLAVYAAGVIVPYVTDSPSVLNLHLLRVSTFFHIFAAFGCAALVIFWLRQGPADHKNIWAYGLIAISSLPKLFILTPFYIAARKIGFVNAIIARVPEKILIALLVLAGGLSLSGNLYINYKRIGTINQNNGIDYAVGAWANENTNPDSIFLLSINGGEHIDHALFQYVSKRQIWVSHKIGAAAMWYPPYYQIWHQRMQETKDLKTLDDTLSYARRNSIGYVLTDCDESARHAYKYKDFCVYNVRH